MYKLLHLNNEHYVCHNVYCLSPHSTQAKTAANLKKLLTASPNERSRVFREADWFQVRDSHTDSFDFFEFVCLSIWTRISELTKRFKAWYRFSTHDDLLADWQRIPTRKNVQRIRQEWTLTTNDSTPGWFLVQIKVALSPQWFFQAESTVALGRDCTGTPRREIGVNLLSRLAVKPYGFASLIDEQLFLPHVLARFPDG